MSETPEQTAVLVVDAPDHSRFEISVDGVPVGFTEYVDAPREDGGTERTFPHTEIDEAYGGRGLATILIQTALDATRTSGFTVLPRCLAVRKFISRHADYLDLVPADRRADFDL